LMNVDSVDKARETVGALPLVEGGFASYEFLQVGPLAPLGRLIPA
jgi:hypothetical protein